MILGGNILSNTFSTVELKNAIAEFLRCDLDISDIYLKILLSPREKAALVMDFVDADKNNLDCCLEVLSSLCLISDYSGRDNVQLYYAIDPQFAFPALILTEMWDIDTNLHTISDLLKRKDLVELNARYKSCQIIVRNIKELYKKQLPFLKEAAVVVNGYKRIASCISELLEAANSDIFAVLSPPHLLGEIVWQAIIEKMQQGISYQRITTFDELIRHGYKIYKNEIQSYNETLYVCRNDTLSHKFYVINDITLAFFSPDTKNKDFLFRVQIMNNAGIAQRHKNIYEKLRSESINLCDLLIKITPYRSNFFSNAKNFLSDDELEWLKSVFDYGVFCKHKKFDKQVYASAKSKCIEHGAIVITAKDEILANYTLQEVLDYVV
jgi:hypothetical protein